MAVRFNDSHYRSYIAKSHVEFVEQQSYTEGIQRRNHPLTIHTTMVSISSN